MEDALKLNRSVRLSNSNNMKLDVPLDVLDPLASNRQSIISDTHYAAMFHSCIRGKGKLGTVPIHWFFSLSFYFISL